MTRGFVYNTNGVQVNFLQISSESLGLERQNLFRVVSMNTHGLISVHLVVQAQQWYYAGLWMSTIFCWYRSSWQDNLFFTLRYSWKQKTKMIEAYKLTCTGKPNSFMMSSHLEQISLGATWFFLSLVGKEDNLVTIFMSFFQFNRDFIRPPLPIFGTCINSSKYHLWPFHPISLYRSPTSPRKTMDFDKSMVRGERVKQSL